MFENFLTPRSITGETYVFREKLGEGAHGAAYKCYNLNDPDQIQPYTIRISTKRSLPEHRINTITKQATLYQLLLSPHTPICYDYSIDRINPYLILEFIPETLNDKIQHNTVDQTLMINYIKQIPQLLILLESNNKVHTELKCANLGIKNNTLKILDLEDMQPPGQQTLPPKNTYLHFPPEYRNYGLLTPTSDMYTVARNIEHLLTGELTEDIEEALTTIELYHNCILPNSFKQLFRSMTQDNPESRPHPKQLQQLTTTAIQDLSQQEYFKSDAFENQTVPGWILEL